MLLSKKGSEAPDVILIVWRTIIVSLTIGVVGVFAAFAGITDIKADALDIQQMALNMIHSPDLLAYEDATTGRVYPGSIDLEKFAIDNIQSSIMTDRNDLAMKYTLSVEGENHELVYVSSGRSDADEFEIYEVLVDQGRGNGRVFHDRVLVKTEGGFAQGVLETRVILSS